MAAPTADLDRRASIATGLVTRIKKVLGGQPPDIQGAVLANCLVIWLAGHHVPGDEDATRTMRATLLAQHCAIVRQLVTVNAEMIGTTS